jgi:hypothetical protein
LQPIPVFYSFARSGGTLVNQLLGVHPKCLVLSEVNPAASFKPVVEQAVEWLGLVASGETGDFARLPYHRKIALLHERAARDGKQLVVRDWVTVNFLPGAAREEVLASGTLEQALYLERAALKPLPIVVARRGAAVYRSITRHFTNLRELAIEVFEEAYLEYARAVAAFPRIHLEALRERPAAALGEILRRFDLDPSPGDRMLRDFHQFRQCTGNTTLQEQTGSALAERILPPETRGDEERTLDARPALAEADRLMGYA